MIFKIALVALAVGMIGKVFPSGKNSKLARITSVICECTTWSGFLLFFVSIISTYTMHSIEINPTPSSTIYMVPYNHSNIYYQLCPGNEKILYMRKVDEKHAVQDSICGSNTEVLQEKNAIPRIETHVVTMTSGSKLFIEENHTYTINKIIIPSEETQIIN